MGKMGGEAAICLAIALRRTRSTCAITAGAARTGWSNLQEAAPIDASNDFPIPSVGTAVRPCPFATNLPRSALGLLRVVDLPLPLPPCRLLERPPRRLHILLLPPLLHPPHSFRMNHPGALISPQRAAFFDVRFHRWQRTIGCRTAEFNFAPAFVAAGQVFATRDRAPVPRDAPESDAPPFAAMRGIAGRQAGRRRPSL